MRLVINKNLTSNINDIKDINIIQLDSSDFNDNNITYFIYENQIPLIRFTDNGEVYSIQNLSNKLGISNSETVILLEQEDLSPISSGGSSSQGLQETIENGNTASSPNNLNVFNFKLVDDDTRFEFNGKTASNSNETIFGLDTYGFGITSAGSNGTSYLNIRDGDLVLSRIFTNDGNKYVELSFENPNAGGVNLKLPAKPSAGSYTVATLDDIYAVGNSIPTYADNSAATSGGLAVNRLFKTPTGEIRVRV